jgi:hypothetical protein
MFVRGRVDVETILLVVLGRAVTDVGREAWGFWTAGRPCAAIEGRDTGGEA